LLARTLASVLRQADVDFEVIVVDDGSRDGTGAFLHSVADDRLRVIRLSASIGPSAARNAGIEAATAPLIAFCDHDDLWAPEKLGSQVAALSQDPHAGWSCVGAVLVDEGLRIVRARRPPSGPHLARGLLASDTVPGGGSGVVARAELVRSLNGFDTRLTFMPDWDMWIRLALQAPMAACDRPLMAYLRHNQSLTGTGMSLFEREYEYVRDKFRHERRRLGVELSEAETWQWVADSHARAGRRWPAVRGYFEVARRYHSRSAVKRMTAVAVWPSAIRLMDRTERRRITPEWMREAEAWLTPYRTGDGYEVGSNAAAPAS